jgi:hypothetical protein
MMTRLGTWVKEIVADGRATRNEAAARQLEERIASEGQRHLARLLEGVLQLAVDEGGGERRACPRCGRRRRHKGRQTRQPLSRLGPIRLTGVYWHCRHCGRGDHAAASLVGGTMTAWLEELLTLLGTTQASFAKASRVADKLLGVTVEDETVRRLCQRQGRRLMAAAPPPTPLPPETDLIGSCDGTMVHTRQRGWRELKSYLFSHAEGRFSGAYLESSQRFVPRLRRAAQAVGAARARQLFFLSDAADWIDRGVRSQLPMAVRIIDLWHACQHVHAAGDRLHGEGTAAARRWGRLWTDRLRRWGGRRVLGRLEQWMATQRTSPGRRCRRAMKPLLTYLRRQQQRLDYPRYEAQGWPISSGPMESHCKQLGRRLKGPGMRWHTQNVDPMAALVCLWTDDRWDNAWRIVA